LHFAQKGHKNYPALRAGNAVNVNDFIGFPLCFAQKGSEKFPGASRRYFC